MATTGHSTLIVRIGLATLWAGLLVFSGLWAIGEWSWRFHEIRGACLLFGATLIAMGLFVFTALVADRLFPGADRRITGAVEGLCALASFAGVGLILLRIFGVSA
ncbi:MAG: hypothetical protein ACREJO_10645 [Phycisphaerales bacterium]